MAGMIDLDAPGDYPIVLSDALMGRGTKDVYTGVRYNHKPDATDDSDIHIEPVEGDRYGLSVRGGNDTFNYEGTRQSKDDQYILVFDPEKKHFVLHQIDSSFDMNLTGPEASTYEQLGNVSKSKPRRKSAGQTKALAAPKKKAEPKKKKPVPKKLVSPDASDEDEESDDGLTVEYPDGPPKGGRISYKHNSAYNQKRQEDEDSEADAEGESEDDMMDGDRDVDRLNLHDEDAEGEEEEANLEADLEAELEAELEKEMAGGSSESESEEE